jgi:hypothetical protein
MMFEPIVTLRAVPTTLIVLLAPAVPKVRLPPVKVMLPSAVPKVRLPEDTLPEIVIIPAPKPLRSREPKPTARQAARRIGPVEDEGTKEDIRIEGYITPGKTICRAEGSTEKVV